ncbi:transporter substrate-binding domain-containing protein [Duganella sp. LX20W]|uniref:Transporter substrate-binding domain-containing protein n=2 Tax=Rugamonas brunnea TaxID=2758569 RepID=A0A7W2IB85_9BURK|nr:transporter substrate-binding domain-containing protein [Rugamonas brunnea]
MVASAAALADDKITLSFNERPPYLIADASGAATGLTGTPAAEAFKKAGIDIAWSKVPPNHQLDVIKAGGPNCAIGWYKTAEREQFAKFTKPLYRDKPTILLANLNFNGKDGEKLGDILASKGVRVLIKEHFSYGPFIDSALEKYKPATTISNGTSTQMLQLVGANSVDFMFVSEEEAQYLVEQSGLGAQKFKLLHMSDMPKGDYRYIMCSKQVPDDVIAKLNKAIAEKRIK